MECEVCPSCGKDSLIKQELSTLVCLNEDCGLVFNEEEFDLFEDK